MTTHTRVHRAAPGEWHATATQRNAAGTVIAGRVDSFPTHEAALAAVPGIVRAVETREPWGPSTRGAVGRVSE